MDRPVRIGVIGVGQIGMRHLHSYFEIPEAQVVAVSDLAPDRIAAAQEIEPGAQGHADFRDLLRRDDIDAVDVCVHNNKHAPISIAALQAGKHVYCEKPMSGAYADSAAMGRAAVQAGRMLHVQMAFIYTPEARAAKRIIDDGHLGDIYYARSFGFRRRGRPYVDGYGAPSFVDKAVSGGGALFDMGVYHLTQVLHLIGCPEVLSVTGAVHQRLDMYKERRIHSGYSVEELALGWVRLA